MTTNVTRYSRTVVGLVLALSLFCFSGFSAAFAQQQMDAATKEDIQQLLQVLENALALEPSDNQTLSLLAQSYELERIGMPSPEENAALAKKALSLRERGLGNAKPAQRFHALGQLATDAFDAGDTAKAGQYASELLQSAPEFTSDWSYGNAIHTGNIVLGRVALQHW